MSVLDVARVGIFMLILFALTKPLGWYIERVLSGGRNWLSPVLRPVERACYAIAGVDPDEDQPWTAYAAALMVFSVAGILLTYVILRIQNVLPLNPQGLDGVAPDLAFNTSVSFVTNTNWQSYVPEVTMSYLSQMAGLATHNFMSAATGIAIAVAVTRGLARRSAAGIGNFWADLIRTTLYVLLPISVVVGLVMVFQGVPQNFNGYVSATTIEGGTQAIAQGPVASQEVIKMFGTNGGGFFNANSAHPYENPTPFTNELQMLLIFAIPAALTYTFGRMVKDTRQGWAIWAAMGIMFVVFVFIALPAEWAGNPLIRDLGVDQTAGALQTGGNFEGKEMRFGTTESVLFAIITTAASCGAVNAMHDSLLPLTGMFPLINMHLGEVVFGGVGAGLYGMLVFVILAVFIAGLMVGRTPEYLGKKIQAFEMKMAMLAVLVLALSVLGFAGLASVIPAGTSSILNPGAHGFSEMLYAFTSATANNGSAFAGISANTIFYNTTLAIAMFVGRFFFIIPVLALAGSMAKKKSVPAGLGTFPTNGATFVGLLIGVVVIVGALTYFPALALGPIVEQLMLNSGQSF